MMPTDFSLDGEPLNFDLYVTGVGYVDEFATVVGPEVEIDAETVSLVEDLGLSDIPTIDIDGQFVTFDHGDSDPAGLGYEVFVYTYSETFPYIVNYAPVGSQDPFQHLFFTTYLGGPSLVINERDYAGASGVEAPDRFTIELMTSPFFSGQGDAVVFGSLTDRQRQALDLLDGQIAAQELFYSSGAGDDYVILPNEWEYGEVLGFGRMFDPGRGFDGGDGNDTLIGGDGDDYILGGSGDDYFDGYGGADVLSGGEGWDIFSFYPGETDGDIITDFEDDEVIVVPDALFDTAALTVAPDGLSIDSDGDSFVDMRIGLDTPAGMIGYASNYGDGTTVEFARLLEASSLVEGIAVADEDINGFAPYRQLNGYEGTAVTLTLEPANAAAGYSNSLGYYEIDADDQIVNVTFLAENVKEADASYEIELASQENQLSFFIIQDGANVLDEAVFDEDLGFTTENGFFELTAGGDIIEEAIVFTALEHGLNVDGEHHVVAGFTDEDAKEIRVGFEDMVRDGMSDDDFQDVVFTVEVTGDAGVVVI